MAEASLCLCVLPSPPPPQSAANVILMDDDFSSIVNGIEEGR
jgi:hypothetical protein